MTQMTMAISGMSCGHCVAAIKATLQQLPGVTVEHVTIGSATVSYQPGAVQPTDITEAVLDAGYEASIVP